MMDPINCCEYKLLILVIPAKKYNVKSSKYSWYAVLFDFTSCLKKKNLKY